MIHMRKKNAFVTKLVFRCVKINILPLAVVVPYQAGRKVSGPSSEGKVRSESKATRKPEGNGWREGEPRPQSQFFRPAAPLRILPQLGSH